MDNKIPLTGATYPLNLSGMEFRASVLNDKDYEEINSFIQSEIIETAKKALPPLDQPELRRELLTAAVSAASGVTWGSSEGSRIMATIKGYSRLAYQMIKANHDTSFEHILEHIRGKGDEVIRLNIEEITLKYQMYNTRMKLKDDDGEVSGEDTSEEPKSDEERTL